MNEEDTFNELRYTVERNHLGHTLKVCRNSAGEFHSLDGPAVIGITNPDIQEWHVDGKRHRTDGPAVINSFQTAYYVNGELHREDGPAIVMKTIYGNCYFYAINSKWHRMDGPAKVFASGSGEWWKHDILVALAKPNNEYMIFDEKGFEEKSTIGEFKQRIIKEFGIDSSKVRY